MAGNQEPEPICVDASWADSANRTCEDLGPWSADAVGGWAYQDSSACVVASMNSTADLSAAAACCVCGGGQRFDPVVAAGQALLDVDYRCAGVHTTKNASLCQLSHTCFVIGAHNSVLCRVECWSGGHYVASVVGAFLVLLYPIGVPLSCVVVLWRNRKQIRAVATLYFYRSPRFRGANCFFSLTFVR